MLACHMFKGGRDAGGIFVRAMLPNGSAEIDGRVQVGKHCLQISLTHSLALQQSDGIA